MSTQPTLVDRGFQIAYVVAHRLLRGWWMLRHPRTSGTLVAVWNSGELLIVKNSYRAEYTLPGGYRQRGESAPEAGARELLEECAIVVPAARLREAYVGEHRFEHRRDGLSIVEIELSERPSFHVDHREVVWADFKAPRAVLALRIVPHLREYLERHPSHAAEA